MGEARTWNWIPVHTRNGIETQLYRDPVLGFCCNHWDFTYHVNSPSSRKDRLLAFSK
jgi:hypothetical protein